MNEDLYRVDSGVDSTPYRPIDSENGDIRLLEVFPGEYHDDMIVSLKYVNLSQNPVYPVLSYVWGEKVSIRRCIVDGIPLSVTLNLFNFLIHLRSSTEKRTIWIDALCINQASPDERAAQVQQMKTIYEQAICIYGWLGLPYNDEETRQAVIMMRECNKYLREGLRDNDDDIGIVFSKITPSISCFPGNAKAWMGWDGIAEICNQHFWRRLWIYQEVTTPKKITFWCAHHEFDDTLITAATAMAVNFAMLPNFADRFARSCGYGSSAFNMLGARIRRTEGRILTLIELMEEMRVTDCTDVRDRVFACLKHAVDVPIGRFTIDYEIDPVALFIDAARYMLLETAAGLGTLRYVFVPAPESTQAPLRARFLPAMPSWIPDWRMKVNLALAFSNFVDHEHGNAPLYTPLPGPVSVCIKSTELHVQGLLVHNVEITSLTSIWDGLDHNWRTPHRWYKELLAQANGSAATETAIRRSMLAGRSYFKESVKDVKYKYNRGGVLDWRVIEATTSGAIPDPGSLVRPDDMFTNLSDVCYGRRMGFLSNGSVAVLPAAAKLNDKIAAFRGGNCLYLVELVDNESQRNYKFVGECYVDGWMDGELANETQQAVETLVLV